MTVDFVWLMPPVEPSRVVGRTAYRLVQEGLTNARKHAPGAPVEVVLDGAAGRSLRIEVSNELTEWPHPPPAELVHGSGTGRIGVGERVALAGGRVEYGAEDDRFRLEAWLPWPD